ncbi:hypothetical protein HYV44_00980 [Candidatus Microgenomates bacterium]|nr:hypothetical protein [Candidatus Microgenomates bacterium]
MTFVLTKNILRVLTISFTSLYLVVAIFGINFSFANSHAEQASQCVSMSHGPNLFCPLNVVQQITDWQTRFAGVMNYFSLALLLIVSLYLVEVISYEARFFSKKFYRQRRIFLRSLYLWPQLFSAGILNPKLF